MRRLFGQGHLPAAVGGRFRKGDGLKLLLLPLLLFESPSCTALASNVQQKTGNTNRVNGSSERKYDPILYEPNIMMVR